MKTYGDRVSMMMCYDYLMWLLNTITKFKFLQVFLIKTSLTQSSLLWSCLSRYLKQDKRVLHTAKNKYGRGFIKKTVQGVGVLACVRKLVTKSYKDVVIVLKKYLEISELFANCFKHNNTIEN